MCNAFVLGSLTALGTAIALGGTLIACAPNPFRLRQEQGELVGGLFVVSGFALIGAGLAHLF